LTKLIGADSNSDCDINSHALLNQGQTVRPSASSCKRETFQLKRHNKMMNHSTICQPHNARSPRVRARRIRARLRRANRHTQSTVRKEQISTCSAKNLPRKIWSV
jgi:hypothetical protein